MYVALSGDLSSYANQTNVLAAGHVSENALLNVLLGCVFGLVNSGV